MRVTVWYYCTGCHVRDEGAQGRLLCGVCGAQVRSIGYRIEGGPAPAPEALAVVPA